mgnify:CR=1 FL=1
MAAPLQVDGLTIGNRYTVHPMEGWDALDDGRPSDSGRTGIVNENVAPFPTVERTQMRPPWTSTTRTL